MSEKTQHIVIDLETLGTSANSIVLEIGAVRIIDGEVDEFNNFDVFVDGKSCEALGMTADTDTVLWWMQQPVETVSRFANDCVKAEVPAALEFFKDWFRMYYGCDSYVWARGPEFDVAILANAFRKCGKHVPWEYRNVQSLRTIDYLNDAMGLGITRPEPETKHSAVDDALADARYLAMFLKAVQEGGK